MRIFAISHASVVPAYRRKWDLIAREPGVKLTVLISSHWPEASLPAVRWEGERPTGYRLIMGPVWFRGRKGHISRYCFPLLPLYALLESA